MQFLTLSDTMLPLRVCVTEVTPRTLRPDSFIRDRASGGTTLVFGLPFVELCQGGLERLMSCGYKWVAYGVDRGYQVTSNEPSCVMSTIATEFP